MTINVTSLPDASAAIPQVRAVAQAISSPGVNDAAALARQQLPSAVPTPTLVAGYAPNIASPPKQPVRNPPAASSSAFAAQFIAQTPGATQEDLEIFTVIPQPTAEGTPEEAPVDDFLASLRLARGDVATTSPAAPEQAASKPQTAAQQPAQANQAQPETQAAPQAVSTAAATVTSSVVASLVPSITIRTTPALASAIGALPPLASSAPTRKSTTLANARGANAYVVAESRNTGPRSYDPISAVL